MSISYFFDDSDADDISKFISALHMPEDIESYEIWPADMGENYAFYVSAKRKPEVDYVVTGDCGYRKFTDKKQRDEFMNRIVACLAEKGIQHKVDYELGDRILKAWQAHRAASVGG